MSPFIIKIFGALGTGKTRTLERLVEWLIEQRDEEIKKELIEKGFPGEVLNKVYTKYNLSDIAFATFQTSALKEFINRLEGDLN